MSSDGRDTLQCIVIKTSCYDPKGKGTYSVKHFQKKRRSNKITFKVYFFIQVKVVVIFIFLSS